ncbi:MAG TPA: hypothetical protein PLL69_02635 [Gemmatimonadales bacterium]|nr:hypothetical protein [Gemmatimonadales bacterium]
MSLLRVWRPLLALGGILILIGGPMHPGGTMAEMLAHPDWVPSHALQLAGFIALTVALYGFWRQVAAGEPMRRWAGIGFWASLFQTVEMAFHLAAAVDAGNLVAGAPTPILTIHLALAVVAYPVFGAAMIGMLLTGARTRELGSPWTAWFGAIGAAAHGIAPVLVVTFEQEWARALFPAITLFALWTVVTAIRPRPRTG